MGYSIQAMKIDVEKEQCCIDTGHAISLINNNPV